MKKVSLLLSVLFIMLFAAISYAGPSDIAAAGVYDGKTITIHQMIKKFGFDTVEWYDAAPNVAVVVFHSEGMDYYYSIVFTVHGDLCELQEFAIVENGIIYSIDSRYQSILDKLFNYFYNEMHFELFFTWKLMVVEMKENGLGDRLN